MITIKDDEFWRFVHYIHQNFGINLAKKKTLVEVRLSNLLENKGFHKLSDYMEFVLADRSGQELTELLNRITTNHTFFMREQEHFQFMSKVVLPKLKRTNREKDLRIWSAGCSTGEEPYTLMMLIFDALGLDQVNWDTSLLATDISIKALKIAQAGIYPEEALRNVPDVWKRRYFKTCPNQEYAVVDEIKQEVIFRTLNLMDESFPFRRKFQVIFCRNVMIYFDQETKMKLVKKFYDLTEPGGYLFIGHSESISRLESDYDYIMPAVYQKRG